MLKVTVGDNMHRTSVVVSGDTTLRSVFEGAEIDYSRGASTLDGSTLSPGDLDKTFNDFGITEKAFLLSVTKADNA